MPINKVTYIAIDETLNSLRITGNDKQLILNRIPQPYPFINSNYYHIEYFELDTLIHLLAKVKVEVEKLKKEQ